MNFIKKLSRLGMSFRLIISLRRVRLYIVIGILFILTAIPFFSQVQGIWRGLKPDSKAKTTGKTAASKTLTDMAVNGAVLSYSIESYKNGYSFIDFYSQYTGDQEIARVILEESLELDVPVHVAFSLAWKESRFDHRAVSPPNRGGTRDWGLFQLNDGGRKNWTENDFFDIRKNTYSGLYYLRHCISEMGNLRLGLAAYNAGIYGVRNRGIPESTKHYIDSILEFESGLDDDFNHWINEQTSQMS